MANALVDSMFTDGHSCASKNLATVRVMLQSTFIDLVPYFFAQRL